MSDKFWCGGEEETAGGGGGEGSPLTRHRRCQSTSNPKTDQILGGEGGEGGALHQP